MITVRCKACEAEIDVPDPPEDDEPTECPVCGGLWFERV